MELPVVESKLKKTKANLRGLNSLVDKRKEEMVMSEDKLIKFQKDVEDKQVKLNQEFEAHIKKLKVRQEEIEEVVKIKAQLKKHKLDLQTLITVTKEFSHGNTKT